MKVFQYRFARFVQFLKENNAEIRIPNGATYYAKTKHNKPSLKDLLLETTGMPESSANVLLSKEPVLNKAHTNKKSLSGIGKFIDAIHFYYQSDGPVISSKNKQYRPNPFGIRPPDPVYPYDEIKRDGLLYHIIENKEYIPIYGEWGAFEFGEEYKNMMRSIPEYAERISTMFPQFYTDEFEEYPFGNELSKLESIYGYNILQSDRNLVDTVTNFFNLFISKSSNPKRKHHLIPDYPDFYLPIRKDLCLKSYEKHFADFEWYSRPENIELETLLKFRYELLHKLKESENKIQDWGIHFHALLIVTYFEFDRVAVFIDDKSRDLIEDLRFIVFSSENNDGTNYQQHDISLDELAEIIIDYNFLKGIENSIEIKGPNILQERLIKFPEPEAVKNGFNKSYVKTIISDMFKNYFEIKLKQDLNLVEH